jgi:hypothetical protein
MEMAKEVKTGGAEMLFNNISFQNSATTVSNVL